MGNILQKIDEALAPRNDGPTHLMLIDILRFTKLLTADYTKAAAKDSAEFRAKLSQTTGFSQPDAVKERKRLVAEAVSGKGDPKKLPTVPELIQRNADIRRVVKHQASAISRKACLRAADVLEKALAMVPEYTADLLDQERRIFPALHLINGKSPLAGTCEQLPAFIKTHISKLRDNPTPMVDPKNLLTLN